MKLKTNFDEYQIKEPASNQCPECGQFIKKKLIVGKQSIGCPHCGSGLHIEDDVLVSYSNALRDAEDDMGIPRGTLDVCMDAD